VIDLVKYHKIRRQILRKHPNLSVTDKDGCILLQGELDSWDNIVQVGYLAASLKCDGVINEIKLKGYQPLAMRISPIVDRQYDGLQCDVLIVGGGIIGTAILREFSKYKIKAVLIEKESDVALHASSRNDGCIHVGIDLSRHSLKHKYLRRAVLMYEDLAHNLNVEYRKTGQTLVFTKAWMRAIMPFFVRHAIKKGIKGTRIINRRELLEREPHINKEARFAVFFPDGAIISPYNMVVALAENAIQNGAQILLDTAALSMEVSDQRIKSVATNRGTIYPRVVVNAAGVFSDVLAKMACDQCFTIHPRQGVEVILDKKASKYMVNSSLSFYRGSGDKKVHTKGGGVIPTVDGNILVGPTANEIPEREDFSTSIEEINALITKHRQAIPNLRQSDIITYFAGIRAATYEEDFVIRKGKWTTNIIHAAGIQSPGLTAAPAIAEDIVKFYQEITNESLNSNPSFNPIRNQQKPLKDLSESERDALIRQNPDYGQIICRCEEISKGEIIDALHRPLEVNTLDGIKRRIRAGMGRCQGGFCQPLITQIMAHEKNLSLTDIKKKGTGSILLNANKEDLK